MNLSSISVFPNIWGSFGASLIHVDPSLFFHIIRDIFYSGTKKKKKKKFACMLSLPCFSTHVHSKLEWLHLFSLNPESPQNPQLDLQEITIN